MVREMTEYFLKISLCYLNTKKLNWNYTESWEIITAWHNYSTPINCILFVTLSASMTEQEAHIWQVSSNGQFR